MPSSFGKTITLRLAQLNGSAIPTGSSVAGIYYWDYTNSNLWMNTGSSSWEVMAPIAGSLVIDVTALKGYLYDGANWHHWTVT